MKNQLNNEKKRVGREVRKINLKRRIGPENEQKN